MEAFASYTDFEIRMGITLTDDEQTRVDSLLADASDLLRLATQQDISLVEGDTLTTRGHGGLKFVLPQIPVLDVTSITATDTRTDETTDLEPDTFYNKGNVLYRTPGSLGWYDGNYELTFSYDHGYETPPTLFKTIAVEAVRRVWINPGAVASETHGSESVSHGPVQSGLLLTAEETALAVAGYGEGKSGTIGLK